MSDSVLQDKDIRQNLLNEISTYRVQAKKLVEQKFLAKTIFMNYEELASLYIRDMFGEDKQLILNLDAYHRIIRSKYAEYERTRNFQN